MTGLVHISGNSKEQLSKRKRSALYWKPVVAFIIHSERKTFESKRDGQRNQAIDQPVER
jgi:hypothetical protein